MTDTTQKNEDIARRQGWQDEKTWAANGNDPSLHRSAEEFLAIGEIINARAKPYEQRIADVEARHKTEMNKAYKHIDALKGGLVKTSTREYERALSHIKAEIKAATEDGDANRVERLLGDMDELNKSHEEDIKAEVETAQPELDSAPDGLPDEIVKWKLDNSWLENPQSKEDMQKIVEVEWAAKEFSRTNPNATPAQVVERLDKAVEEFEKGKNMPSDTPGENDKITPRERTPRQQTGKEHYGMKTDEPTFDNLPMSAREQFREFVEAEVFQNTPEDRKRFIESYNQEERIAQYD